jgi:BBSome-interacting protein 1
LRCHPHHPASLLPLQSAPAPSKPILLREVIPLQGAVFVERCLSEVLCKPKILPIKSVALEKVEQIERESAELSKARRAGTSKR